MTTTNAKLTKIDEQIQSLESQRQAETAKQAGRDEQARQRRIAALAKDAKETLEAKNSELVNFGKQIQKQVAELETSLAGFETMRNAYGHAYQTECGKFSQAQATREETRECFESLEKPTDLKVASSVYESAYADTATVMLGRILDSSAIRERFGKAWLGVILVKNKFMS